MIKDESGNRRFFGIYRGIVTNNADPLNRGRLKLVIPQVLLEEETGWAWAMVAPGSQILTPNVGEGVWVTFEGGDPSYPIWMGLFSEAPTNVASYAPTWSGTGLAYTGTPTRGSYTKLGKLVFFKIKVNFTTVTNFGTGQYHLTLPIAPDDDYIFRDGGLHQGSVHYNIAGDAAAGTTTLTIYHMQNTNGSNSYVYDDPFTGVNPVTLTTAGYMYLSGTYLTA